ncbi:uncharacterized protein [Triticum aestivum]|uniref:uncharacterized protein n=1 Tax=Triticum aestivum TaxID=4565 RepID=UPI0008446CBE|nr:uncharacterized protein LOC123092122 [Triticum aestivum]XP_044369739.1 uncharacterized protein LOC123092122 [Triticum aestivum]
MPQTHSPPRSLCSPPPERLRLMSIVVRPFPCASLSSSGHGDEWTEVQSRKDRRLGRCHDGVLGHDPRPRKGHRPAFNASAGREAFLRRFRGLCFRCLSSKHRCVDCRDPVCCIDCKLQGHTSKDCPSKKGRAPVKARLGSRVGRGPICDHIRFPSPPPAVPDKTMAHHTDPLRRPRSSHKVVIETPAMERQMFLLCRHAVLLISMEERHVASPMSVGRAFDTQLRMPAHLLRVTSHDPEDFLVHFELLAHKDNAIVHLGSINVDGVIFNIKPWHEDDHFVHQEFLLHVCTVIEKMPLHLWSLEGAAEVLSDKCIIDRLDSRNHERGHLKTFACWVWVWDVAFIPTRHHLEGAAGCWPCGGHVGLLAAKPRGGAATARLAPRHARPRRSRRGLVTALFAFRAEWPALVGV